MRDLSNFIITSLATYRISRIAVEDEIFAEPRNKIWEKFPPESTKIGYLFTCYWCSSIYAASALEISRIIAPKTTRAVETALAASAVAGIVAARLED